MPTARIHPTSGSRCVACAASSSWTPTIPVTCSPSAGSATGSHPPAERHVDFGRPSLRLLALFGAVALPPLVGLAALLSFAPDFVARVGMGTALLIAVAAGAVWAAVVAVAGSRAIGRDLSVLVELAERGAPGIDVSPDALSVAQRRLANALDERNRQIASLAAALGAAPITGTATQVAASVVTTARRVTGDPTWELAVLHAGGEDLLP